MSLNQGPLNDIPITITPLHLDSVVIHATVIIAAEDHPPPSRSFSYNVPMHIRRPDSLWDIGVAGILPFVHSVTRIQITQLPVAAQPPKRLLMPFFKAVPLLEDLALDHTLVSLVLEILENPATLCPLLRCLTISQAHLRHMRTGMAALVLFLLNRCDRGRRSRRLTLCDTDPSDKKELMAELQGLVDDLLFQPDGASIGVV